MPGFFAFFFPFLLSLAFVLPGVFDSTMMSRLAVFPLVGSIVFFHGRKYIPSGKLFIGSAIALLPAVALLWAPSPAGGIPYAVRWFSFGMMIIGFSGTVARWGIKSHLAGLVAAAVITAVVLLAGGTDTVPGNANRTGMVLATGFIGSLILFNRKSWYSLASTAVTATGLFSSHFYIGWIAGTIGAFVLFFAGRFKIRAWMILLPMIAGQILFSLFPGFAGRIGPTLELRTRIWNYSSSLVQEYFPLGTGTGSARTGIFNSSEPELRALAGGDKRIDYLHSEPLTMVVETGIPGFLLLIFILYRLEKNSNSPGQLALLAAFWVVFTSDLPLATPLGALPAALFLGSTASSSKEKKYSIPAVVPVVLLIVSLYWGFLIISGYSALENSERGAVSEAETACRRIPWEERAFLAAGWLHLRNNMVLSSLDDSEHFLELYPGYYRGWELRASALDAAGRNSGSAWARAALLVPDNLTISDKYLFALNAIQAESMDSDTSVALSIIVSYQEQFYDIIESMTVSDVMLVSEKLLALSEQCRSISMYDAGRVWFMAMGLALESGEQVPADLAFNLVGRRDLYGYLDMDWKPKADEYIELLAEKSGIEPSSILSP